MRFAATTSLCYAFARAAVPEQAAGLESFPAKGRRGTSEAATQKRRAGLWSRCGLGCFPSERCLQRERTPLLTPDASSCIRSQIPKKMFVLPAWAKVNDASVAAGSMPRVPEEVIPKSDLVFPWRHPAAEESCWKGRSAEQDSPVVNNE